MKKNRYIFIALLLLQTLGLLIYTAMAINNDGVNFLEKAKEFVLSVSWMGQFALDFQCYLILSAIWIAWRNRFSSKSVFFAIIAAILGIVVFAPYLIYLTSQEKGNISKILIGDR